MLNSAKAVARGVDGNLHYPVPSINRLNQTEPARFYNFTVLGKDDDDVTYIVRETMMM
jgi:hypothetical protein